MSAGGRGEPRGFRALRFAAARAALVLAVAAGCSRGGPAPADAPNVILISVDTMRADHVGVYGAAGAETPTMDGLAAVGVRFRTAFSVAPITLVSHATIFTGLYPPRHGVRHNGIYRLGPGIPTLAERLRGAGYDTGAVIGSIVLEKSHGLDRGFRVYDDAVPQETGAKGGFREHRAATVTDRAIAWLSGARRPFFLFVHYFDPHAVYEPPEPFATRFRDRPYDGEIAYVDAEIARLLADVRARDLLAGTVVILTADHGESLGEHQELTHGYTLYDATLAVPLLVSGPRIPPGVVVNDLVSLVDLAPTVLALAGVAPLPDRDGRDLAPLWTGTVGPRRGAYAETLSTRLDHGWSPLHAWRTDEHLYVRAPRPELYAVRTDPGEVNNLLDGTADGPRAIAEPLDREIAARVATERASEPRQLDPATRERLRALGYHLADAPVGYSGIDPKDGIRWAEPFFDALAAVEDGATEAPRAFLTDMLRALPDSPTAHALMARVLMAQGQPDDALTHAQEATRLVPENAVYHALLGGVFERLGRLADATKEYQEADRLDPDGPQTQLRHIWFRARRGEFDRADADVRRLVRSDPLGTDNLLKVAAMWFGLGQFDRAVAAARQVLEIDAASERAHMLLAIYLARTGNDAEAADHLKRAGALPDTPAFKEQFAAAHAQAKEGAEPGRSQGAPLPTNAQPERHP